MLDLRGFLRGPWSLARTMDDRRLGQAGTFRGIAVFLPDGAGLVHREEGKLRFGTHEGAAGRVYRYGFCAPHRAFVRFEDGRSFHALDLSRGRWRVRHHCGADRYLGAFHVAGPDAWEVVWRISGPRKDLVLKSRYLRSLTRFRFAYPGGCRIQRQRRNGLRRG